VGQQEYSLKSIINAIYNGFLVFRDSELWMVRRVRIFV